MNVVSTVINFINSFGNTVITRQLYMVSTYRVQALSKIRRTSIRRTSIRRTSIRRTSIRRTSIRRTSISCPFDVSPS